MPTDPVPPTPVSVGPPPVDREVRGAIARNGGVEVDPADA